ALPPDWRGVGHYAALERRSLAVSITRYAAYDTPTQCRPRGIGVANTHLMQYHALAVDYDGTLATDGVVDEKTIDALRRLRESGRRLVLVTGRIIEQLCQLCPQLRVCDMLVADNGALLYEPETEHKHPLAEPPPREFIEELARRGVPRLEIGD